jgi:hypothetical protein
MREFTSLTKYSVRGETVFAVALDRDSERAMLFHELKTEGVMIDGREYELLGVESFAIPTLRKGSPIGLMVRPAAQPTQTQDTR